MKILVRNAFLIFTILVFTSNSFGFEWSDSSEFIGHNKRNLNLQVAFGEVELKHHKFENEASGYENSLILMDMLGSASAGYFFANRWEAGLYVRMDSDHEYSNAPRSNNLNRMLQSSRSLRFGSYLAYHQPISDNIFYSFKFMLGYDDQNNIAKYYDDNIVLEEINEKVSGIRWDIAFELERKITKNFSICSSMSYGSVPLSGHSDNFYYGSSERIDVERTERSFHIVYGINYYYENFLSNYLNIK